MRVTELPEVVVNRGLCIGCGMCTAVNAGKAEPLLRMEYDPRHDHAIPVINAEIAESESDVVCPGAAMKMPELSTAVYGALPEDSWVGHHQRIRAAYAADTRVRECSASGGITTALLTYLFKSNAIDIAYCVVSEGEPYTRTGKIVRRAEDLAAIHGSVYQPAVLGAELSTLIEGTERFAFVGLPCEIAALEMMKQKDKGLASRHVLSIGLFCGGINRFDGVNYYLKKFGTQLQGALGIDYRYGAWPGKIRIVEAGGKAREIPRIRGNSRWNILRYVIGFQGYWMLPRCRMCPDQISDFADVAVGDPHLPRFRSKQGQGYSAIVLRSDRGAKWYDLALSDGFIIDEPLGREELIASQGYTLDNRRYALAYASIAKIFRMPTPELSVYAEFGRPKLRHYKYAFVDLLKIKMHRVRALRPLYVPFQIFEYLFITLAPRVFITRLVNLFINK